VNIKPEYWELLLEMRSLFKSLDPYSDRILIDQNFKAKISPEYNLSLSDIALIRFYPKHIETDSFYEIVYSDFFPKKAKKIFKLYLGYILVNKSAEMPFVCVHLAQTLDGKIATRTGKSKWIGNKENLIHAHRIRALVDAILIGGNTFRLDKPKLNVRLVKGENPIKVIVANSTLELKTLSEGKTYLLSNNELVYDKLPFETEIINLDTPNCAIHSEVLLKKLKSKEIHTILIEGGSHTIRKFIEEKTLSRIEFHIAPILFGSGKNGIELEEIDELDEAIFLKNPKHYKFGNAILTVSNIK
jgi:diaminohydroxyphosphoribosylaminopyrimidine deaminase/5-amino-6-(5-phosphoribosylamino)uracil reductase